MNGSQRILKLDDLAAADVALKANQYLKAGEYLLTPGEAMAFGFGVGNVETASGRIYALLKDDTAEHNVITGELKFEVHNNQDRYMEKAGIVFEEDLGRLASSPTDFRGQVPFTPQICDNVRVGAFRKIVLFVRPDADCTLDVSESVLKMSMTNFVIQ